MQSFSTTLVVEPSRKGWLCTCGESDYTCSSTIQAHASKVEHEHEHLALIEHQENQSKGGH